MEKNADRTAAARWRRTRRFGATLLLVGAMCCSAAPVVSNGGFEAVENGKAKGWTLPAYYSYAPGMGRNGTAAIAYSFVTNRHLLAPVAQPLSLEPSETYRVSCWVRTEGVKPPKGEPGTKIGVEWKEANGRSHGTYSKSITGTTDWTQISFITPQVPEGLKFCRVQVYTGYGKTPGKAWFDDVTIEKIRLPPISGLYADAYRGAVAEDDALLLKAQLALPRALLTNGLVHVALRYAGTDGKMRERAPDALEPGEAAFNLQANDLQAGEQTVRCTVATNGAVAGEASCRIVRMSAPPKWRVRFDRLGRTLVEGKPFFPLGMYMGTVTATELDVYGEGAFNCLMPYQEPSREMLDLCEQKGLRVIYPLKEVYCHTGWARMRKIRNLADEEAYVTQRVEAYKSHPAILAWYLNDEFGPEFADILAKRRALFERLDPDHPTWNCLYQVQQLNLYMDSIDCIGVDPYPVARRSISMANDWTILARRNTFGVRPVWMIPQAMDWRWFKSGNKKRDRMPTEDEMRSMTWQMIASGANGLIYYAFHQMRRNSGTNFPAYWAAVKSVAADVARFADVLVSDPGPDATANLPPYQLPVRTWRKGGEVFVLAVNATDKPVDAELSLTKEFSEATAVFGENASLRTPKGILAHLPPWRHTLVRLR